MTSSTDLESLTLEEQAIAKQLEAEQFACTSFFVTDPVLLKIHLISCSRS